MNFDRHMLLMVWYAVLTACYFSLLWRENTRDRVRLFLILFLTLFAGGILIAVVMQRFSPGL